jgi:hypothetical protein
MRRRMWLEHTLGVTNAVLASLRARIAAEKKTCDTVDFAMLYDDTFKKTSRRAYTNIAASYDDLYNILAGSFYMYIGDAGLLKSCRKCVTGDTEDVVTLQDVRAQATVETVGPYHHAAFAACTTVQELQGVVGAYIDDPIAVPEDNLLGLCSLRFETALDETRVALDAVHAELVALHAALRGASPYFAQRIGAPRPRNTDMDDLLPGLVTDRAALCEWLPNVSARARRLLFHIAGEDADRDAVMAEGCPNGYGAMTNNVMLRLASCSRCRR